jgi:hypothetical protein
MRQRRGWSGENPTSHVATSRPVLWRHSAPTAGRTKALATCGLGALTTLRQLALLRAEFEPWIDNALRVNRPYRTETWAW